MARRITSYSTVTCAPFADTTAFTTGATMGWWTGSTVTQFTRFWEISISGQANSTSSPMFMLFSRNSAVQTGASSFTAGIGVDAYMDPFTVALANPVVVGNISATLYPQRDTANHLMNCSLNAFGGVFFWRANRAEEAPAMFGSALTFGTCSLSNFTGGASALVGGHVIYETS
jgi:hypothetical protein